MADGLSLREGLAHATERLSAGEHLRPDAARDAVVLLLHVTGLTRADLYAAPDRVLTQSQVAAYGTAIERRLRHEPIQYITGEQEFYGLALVVSPAVLIPRPETEHLVESVLSEVSREEALNILDVGTGSGAIAIALAHHLPSARVTAVDISAEALEVAAANAVRHGLSDRIRFVESDLLGAFGSSETFDVIASNPPYVPSSDRESLHPQVRDFEPEGALYGGPAGLDIYRRLIPAAQAALKPNGLLALEIGHGQRDGLADLLAGWRDVHFVNDLQRIPRVTLARKA